MHTSGSLCKSVSKKIHTTANVAIQVHTHNPVQLFPLTQQVTEPAPLITVCIVIHTGTKEIPVLPDSGADILAVGMDILGTSRQPST